MIVTVGCISLATVLANGTTVKLVVSGGNLRAPVEIAKDVQFAVDFYEELGNREAKRK